MKQKTGRKLLSFLLTLAMVVGLVPGMSLTASAEGTETVATTWAEVQAVFTSGGTVQLGADITAGESDTYLNVGSGKTVVLDLNGHVLSRGLTEEVSTNALGTKLSKAKDKGVVINNGNASSSLTIKDSNPNTQHNVTVYTHSFNGSAMNTYASTQTVYGGVITGGNNNTSFSFGILSGGIYSKGPLTIEGGTICGNAGYYGGGGVHVAGETLTMTGGAITGNLSSNRSGGGVNLEQTATMSMTGGIISDNAANNMGGGVYAEGAFTMSGGTISGNGTGSNAGGVYTSNVFTMNGGTISDNTAKGSGGGVYNTGDFTMTKGTISGNTANYSGGGVCIYKSAASGAKAERTFEMSGGSISHNASLASSGYAGGGGIYVADASTVNIKGTAEISNNTAVNNGGGIYVGTNNARTGNATVTLGGNAKITGNSTAGSSNSGAGGAVYLVSADYTVFTMEGNAEISGNTASNKSGSCNGAAIDVQMYNTFILNGGTIKNNNGLSTVCVRDASSYVNIASNVIAGSDKNGSDATTYETLALTTSNYTNYNYFTFGAAAKPDQTIEAENVTATYGDTGVKITASVTEPASGGGALSYNVKDGSDVVSVDTSGNLTLIKAGTAIVTVTAAATDNYAETTKDVTVTVNKADPNLSYETAVVSKQTSDATFTNALTNPKNVAVVYTSDNTAVATVDADGKVTVKTAGSAKITASFAGNDCYASGSASYTVTVNSPRKVTFNANGGTGTMEPQYFTGEAALRKNSFTREGYLFGGWATSADATEATYADEANASFEKDTTLYAVWNVDDTQRAITDSTHITTFGGQSTGKVTIEKDDGNGFAAATTAKYDDTVKITVEAITVTTKDQNGNDITFNSICTGLTVTDSTGATVVPTEEVKSVDRKSIVFTFTMPARAVNVTATFGATIPINRTEIEAADVTCTYGDTDAKVDATAIGCTITCYAVKEGSEDYIAIDDEGKLTIKKVPADGKAYVIVKANVDTTEGSKLLEKEVKVTIRKADCKVTPPAANNLTANGSAHALVTAGTVEGGTMQYALGNDATTEPTEWSEEIPTGKDAKIYFVWYKVVGDNNHNNSEATSVTATIKCVVKFVDEDGTTVLKEATGYEKGTKADKIVKPADPTKAATAEYTYTFAGWIPEITDVTANETTYKATYKETKNKYTVTFNSNEGSAVASQTVEYGVKAAIPEKPVKEGCVFSGWYADEALTKVFDFESAIAGNITLYAKWDKQVSGVSVTPSEVKLTKAGDTSQINVTVTPADAADTKVTYKSGDTKVATVDENGKITAVANGTTDITVTTEDGGKTATVKVTVAIPDVPKQEEREEPKTSEEPAKEEKAAISMNAGLKISQTGSKINIKWGKVSEADGYDVYVAYCGKEFGKAVKTVKKNSTTSVNVTKINGKKINLKKNYKIYVTAYKMVDGKKVKLAKSIMGHVVGRLNTKYSNAKKITLSKSSYTIKVGKTAKIKAKTVLVQKGKKQLSDAHAAEFRYASSDKKIATVDKNGKITGVAKGSCTIYVYARNGYAKKVKVTVN